jgi:tRNA-splicing ligase RtcB
MAAKALRSDDMDTLQGAGGKPIKLWTDGVPVEDEARKQLLNTAQMPFIFSTWR